MSAREANLEQLRREAEEARFVEALLAVTGEELLDRAKATALAIEQRAKDVVTEQLQVG